MPTPDRKKNKHKKQEKVSSHRSSSKHKSKKKKSSRASSRNRDKKNYKRENKASPLTMQIFGQDIIKKLQEINQGKRTEDLMEALSLLPYMKPQQINNETIIIEQKQLRDKKSIQKQRSLIPINYDSFMIILDDPFYKEYLSEQMINFMKKKLIISMKRQVIDQKSDNFLQKIDRLEQELKKQAHLEELENDVQLGVVNSIFCVLNNKKDTGNVLDPEVKDIFQMMEIEKQDIVKDDIFYEAKQMFL